MKSSERFFIFIFILILLMLSVTVYADKNEYNSGKIEKVEFLIKEYREEWNTVIESASPIKYANKKPKETEIKIREAIYNIEDKKIRETKLEEMDNINRKMEAKLKITVNIKQGKAKLFLLFFSFIAVFILILALKEGYFNTIFASIIFLLFLGINFKLMSY